MHSLHLYHILLQRCKVRESIEQINHEMLFEYERCTYSYFFHSKRKSKERFVSVYFIYFLIRTLFIKMADDSRWDIEYRITNNLVSKFCVSELHMYFNNCIK